MEGHDSEGDYEKMDYEEMEGACGVNPENGGDYNGGSICREPVVGASSEEEEEEEDDYINLTSEQDMQVVDSTEDDESDYENVTKEEQLKYTYGQTDLIYQNMGLEWPAAK